mgnify:FL=1
MQYKNNQKIFSLEEYEIDSNQKLPLLTFDCLSQIPEIKHCFTTRCGGVSTDFLSSLNLGFSRGDESQNVIENYRRVANAMGVDLEDMIISHQTHTTNVRMVGREDGGEGLTKPRTFFDVDGMITNEKGLLLSTSYADCVPLYFVDVIHHAIGLSHSGWRGTVHRMGAVTIDAMKRAFGSRPENIVCAIGPSICRDCYEVSEDVYAEFATEFATVDNFFLNKGDGKYQLDLWKANEEILLEAGILPQNLAITNVCTSCNSNLLYSHRASGGRRGKLGGFLMVK